MALGKIGSGLSFLSWKHCFITFLLLFVFINFFRPIEIEDVWWHLKTGEWVVSHQQVPYEDIFSFSDVRQPWIFTQWLGSSILFLVYHWFDLFGLITFRAIFYTILIGMFIHFAIRRISFSTVVALALFLIPALYFRSHLRPDMFNYLFIQLFLIGLLNFQRTQQLKHVFWIPLAGMVWSNINMGSFIYAPILIGVFFLANILYMILSWIRHDGFMEKYLKMVQALLVLFLLYILSFFCSPYGREAFFYPFKVFLIPDYHHFYFSLGVIEEMASPLTHPYWQVEVWVFSLLFMAGYFIIRQKGASYKLLYFLLLLSSFGLFLRGTRAATFFALVAAYVIVDVLSGGGKGVREYLLNRWQKLFWVFLFTALSMRAVYLYSQGGYMHGVFRRDMTRLEDWIAPSGALEFLERNKLNGAVFNSDLFGGYILWKVYPELKPFIDGRNISERFVLYHQVMRDPQRHYLKIFNDYKIDLVLLSTQTDASFNLIKFLDFSQWQMVYIDQASMVWVRRGVFHLPEKSFSLAEDLRMVKLTAQEELEMNNIIVHRGSGLLGRLPLSFVRYNDNFSLGSACLRMGYKDAGLRYLLSAYQASPNGLIGNTLKRYSLR